MMVLDDGAGRCWMMVLDVWCRAVLGGCAGWWAGDGRGGGWRGGWPGGRVRFGWRAGGCCSGISIRRLSIHFSDKSVLPCWARYLAKMQSL